MSFLFTSSVITNVQCVCYLNFFDLLKSVVLPDSSVAFIPLFYTFFFYNSQCLSSLIGMVGLSAGLVELFSCIKA